jgi:L-threonylcarbamoyladenylate synthase
MLTRVPPAIDALADAAALLAAGELVAFPTETVYGLGADARSDAAVQKIYAAKGRPSGNPLIVHVSDTAHAKECSAAWPDAADRLARHFWPGPLTLIVPRGPTLSPLVSAGRHTVALRCPNHPVAQALLQAAALPIAAPSANRSGFTSPTTAQHVLAELAGRIPLILDGGPCQIGLESTVLDVSDPNRPPRILRPGAITAEMLEKFLGPIESLSATIAESASAESPGQHSRHYAPRTPAFRFGRSAFPAVMEWARKNGPVILLTFSEEVFLAAPQETVQLPPDPASYARTFYAALREVDERRPRAILVLQPDSTTGLWSAIMDRLARATLPFDPVKTVPGSP